MKVMYGIEKGEEGFKGVVLKKEIFKILKSDGSYQHINIFQFHLMLVIF